MPFTYYIAAVVVLWLLVLVAGYCWDQSMELAAEALEPEDLIHNITPQETPFMSFMRDHPPSGTDPREDTL